MTADQAKALVAELDASWNYPFRADPPKVAAWVKTVVVFDHGDAVRALATCKESMPARPAVALFGQMCRAFERQRRDLDAAREVHASRLRALPPAPYNAEADAQRARDHIDGRGLPSDRPATVGYSREWFAHVRPRLAVIGRYGARAGVGLGVREVHAPMDSAGEGPRAACVPKVQEPLLERAAEGQDEGRSGWVQVTWANKCPRQVSNLAWRWPLWPCC